MSQQETTGDPGARRVVGRLLGGLIVTGAAVAVELKYKTRKLLVELDGEAFSLASHSAQDIGRYDFIKDIFRLEKIVPSLENCVGHAIMLTNDSSYWTSHSKSTVDEAFRLTEGRVLKDRRMSRLLK